MAANVEIVGTFTDNASGGLSGFAGNLGNLGNIVTGIKSAFDLAGMAIDTIVGAITPFVESASESEQAVARLDGVLRATGGAAGLTSQQLQNMADGFQEVTRFSDETILNGEAILLTFRNLSGEMFERTVPAMLDMAEIFGSVDSAAMQLGKALNDPVAGMGALSRAGITFSDVQKEMIKNFVETGDIASAQNIILSEVEAQVGGLAQAMGETFSGQAEIFKNQLDSVKETIGGALLPILTDLINTFEVGLPILQDWANVLAQSISTGDFTLLVDRLRETFGNIDWSGIFQSIADSVAAIDWSALGQSIADGIDSIDWGRVGNIVAEGLGQLAIIIGTVLSEVDWISIYGSILGGLVDFFAGLFGFVDWDDMWNNALAGFQYVGQQIVSWFRNTLGPMIVSGLIAGFNLTPFGQITNWFNNLIERVKDIFGIASPSSVFYNIARDIIQGLINGWNAFWGDLVDLATQSLDSFLNMFGIDLSFGGASAGGLGTAGGGTSGSSTTGGGTSSGGQTIINIYGASYWGVSGPGDVGGVYDCPSPHPLVASSGNQLVVTGF